MPEQKVEEGKDRAMGQVMAVGGLPQTGFGGLEGAGFGAGGALVMGKDATAQSMIRQQQFAATEQLHQQNPNRSPFSGPTHTNVTTSPPEMSGASTQNSDTNLRLQYPQATNQEKKQQAFKKANEHKSIYSQTLNMMFQNQQKNSKQKDAAMNDQINSDEDGEGGVSYLSCATCQKQERVVDSGNDLGAQKRLLEAGNGDQGQDFDMEGLAGGAGIGRAAGQGQQEIGQVKDLISTLLAQKCKVCEKFNCLNCLDECAKCQQKTCKLCLDYHCDPQTSEQYYQCTNCKFDII